ncbi:MAG TPA: hypothetical protein VGF97_06645 [Rhizomicrobium sp.]
MDPSRAKMRKPGTEEAFQAGYGFVVRFHQADERQRLQRAEGTVEFGFDFSRLASRKAECLEISGLTIVSVQQLPYITGKVIGSRKLRPERIRRLLPLEVKCRPQAIKWMAEKDDRKYFDPWNLWRGWYRRMGRDGRQMRMGTNKSRYGSRIVATRNAEFVRRPSRPEILLQHFVDRRAGVLEEMIMKYQRTHARWRRDGLEGVDHRALRAIGGRHW